MSMFISIYQISYIFYCCIIAEYIIIIYKYGYGIICIISQSDIILKKITIIHI